MHISDYMKPHYACTDMPLFLLICVYRQDILKKRLSRDFPQLVFHTPAKRNTSELVFAENLSTNAVLDLLPSGAETTQSSEMSQTDSDTERRKSKQPTTAEETRTLYTAALLLKRLLSHSPGMSCPWPPTAVNFNLTEVICCGMRKRCVPGCFHTVHENAGSCVCHLF